MQQLHGLASAGLGSGWDGKPIKLSPIKRRASAAAFSPIKHSSHGLRPILGIGALEYLRDGPGGARGLRGTLDSLQDQDEWVATGFGTSDGGKVVSTYSRRIPRPQPRPRVGRRFHGKPRVRIPLDTWNPLAKTIWKCPLCKHTNRHRGEYCRGKLCMK